MPELQIEKIDEGVFLHQSYSHVNGFGLVSSNGLVVVDDGQAFMVDTPWSVQDTQKLVEWILDNKYQPLGSVSTHSHEDRTAGIEWLNSQSIATYATKLTNDRLKAENKVLAKFTLNQNEAILANGLLEVFYPGGGHTLDNAVVWLPKSNILFGGCLVRSLESKGLGYTGEAHINQWPGSAEKVRIKYPAAKWVIPGHGKMGGLGLLKHTIKLAEAALIKSKLPSVNPSSN